MLTPVSAVPKSSTPIRLDNLLHLLAQQFKVKDGTIINHLYRYAQDGHTFAQPTLLLEQSGLSQIQVDAALAAFTEHSYERLKPVYDSLNEQVTYDQLHLLRIYFVSQLTE